MHEQEEDLARLAQRGDRTAFARLVEIYTRPIYSLCLRMMANPSDAEDLTQETFLHLFSSLGQYRTDHALRPWLFRIAVNACLDALRRRKRTPYLVPLDGNDPDTVEDRADVDNAPTPERAYLSLEKRLAVLEALRSLPPDYRAVIILRYQHSLSYQEIAETLEVPLTTVETRLFRAKRMLRPILARYLETGEPDSAYTRRKEGLKHGMQA